MRTGGRRDQVSPDLLLAEELLLLSLDDEKGSDQTWSSIDGGLAGALLLELTEAGALRLDDDKLVPGASVPTDPLLAEALEVVRSSEKPRDAKHWVTKLPGQLKPLRRRLAERLSSVASWPRTARSCWGSRSRAATPSAIPSPSVPCAAGCSRR
jgi:hypothetical protein